MGVSWKPNNELYYTLEKGLKDGPKKKAGTVPMTSPEQFAEYYDFSKYF